MPSTLESIAADAIFITFPVSDGDNSRRPDNMNPPSSSAREVNWHRTMTMEEKFTCRWRNLIGQGIAKMLNNPDEEKHCLQSFPGGYWMFDHNKGPISQIRHDIYLYGSQTVLRFRSPAEFIPHGFWLLTDPSLNKVNCGCKYCGGSGKKSQTEISQALGLPTNRGPTAAVGRGSTRMRTSAHRVAQPPRNRGIDALPSDTPWVPPALRQERKPDSVWQTLSLKLKLAASATRIADLRSDRRFRVGELVWYRWGEETHTGSPRNGVNRSPIFWPAIVLGYSFESVVKRSTSCYSYSVHHNRRYSMLRLGSSSEEERAQFESIVDEDSVLPWQAHEMGLDSLPSIHSVNGRFDGQLNSFTLALGAAQQLAGFWAVCDRLPLRLPSSLSREPLKPEECAFPSQVPRRFLTPDRDTETVPSTRFLALPVPTDSLPQRSPTRLKPVSPIKRSVIADNDLIEEISTSTSTDDLPLMELSRRVRPLRQARGASVTESRYEGLWYGAERIWMGDVVRLCPERDAFAASLKLSHMARRDILWHEKIAPSPGAAMRGVLMRVDKIFARVGSTGSKECAVAGPIYELAPKVWVENNSTAVSSTPSSAVPSSASPSVPEYYPWNMPQIPPRRLSRDNGDGPMCDSCPLPPPPPGYMLRPLLPPGSEITLPVSFVAGRYYPDILQWSLSGSVLPQVPQDISSLNLAAAAETCGVPLLSLCGLAPGRFNHAVCVGLRLASRTRMIDEAACLAR